MDNQTIVSLLLAAVAANLALMAGLVVSPIIRRRSRVALVADGPGPGGGLEGLAQLVVPAGDIVGSPSMSLDVADRDARDEVEPGAEDGLGRQDAAPEAEAAPRPEDAPASDEAADEEGTDSEGMDTSTTEAAKARRFAMPVFEDHEDRTARAIESFIDGMAGEREFQPVMRGPSMSSNGPESLVDEETGLDSPAAWTLAIRDEGFRVARYHRPVTVVVAELDGLGQLADRLGPEGADRLIAPVADAVRREARASDRVARTGHARFHVLLRETDEIGAINYVERVRAGCDRWLEAGAVAVRLSLGWASPPAGGDLEAALRTAEDRMHAEARSRTRTTELSGR